MSDGVVLIAVSIVLAAVLWIVAWAGAVGRLQRNHVVGIRTPATLRSDAAWSAGHRAAAPYTVLAGIWFLATGLLAGLVGDTGDERASILISGWAIGVVQLGLAVVVAIRAANRSDAGA